jgi:hypothetical protein
MDIARAVMVALVAAFAVAQDDAPAEKHPYTESFRFETGELGPTGTNPYFILESGYILVLEGKDENEDVTLAITVLDETKKVDGVETRVVEERETAGGKIKEVSRNYFAISKRTNSVYYFGEDVDIYKNGRLASHEGAWRHGSHNAHFGLMMPGTPTLGLRHYQELAPKVAMDRVEIVSMTERSTTPAGVFEKCLKMRETTPLELFVRDTKVYAPGIGIVEDGPLKLVSRGYVQKPSR